MVGQLIALEKHVGQSALMIGTETPIAHVTLVDQLDRYFFLHVSPVRASFFL